MRLGDPAVRRHASAPLFAQKQQAVPVGGDRGTNTRRSSTAVSSWTEGSSEAGIMRQGRGRREPRKYRDACEGVSHRLLEDKVTPAHEVLVGQSAPGLHSLRRSFPELIADVGELFTPVHEDFVHLQVSPSRERRGLRYGTVHVTRHQAVRCKMYAIRYGSECTVRGDSVPQTSSYAEGRRMDEEPNPRA